MVLLSGPNINGNEWKYVKDCLDTGWVSSVGSYVTDFEKQISNYVGSKYAIATSSGTTALHLALLALDIKNNEEVIVPNLTYIAPVNSVSYVGAKPILVDVDNDTWLMNYETIIKNITHG